MKKVFELPTAEWVRQKGMLVRLGLFAVLLGPMVAFGQPLIKSMESIELRTLNSQYIVVGRISATEAKSAGNVIVDPERAFRSNVLLHPVNMKVAGDAEQIAKWRASKARLLIFEGSTIDLSAPELLQVNSDGNLLRSAKEILEVVGRTVREHPGVYRMVKGNRGWIKMNGESMLLQVPVEKKLEQWCRETIRKSSDQEARGRAVLSLGHFPSDENIELLKQLQKDRALIDFGSNRKRYLVRDWAWDTLVRFGVVLPKPSDYGVFGG